MVDISDTPRVSGSRKPELANHCSQEGHLFLIAFNQIDLKTRCIASKNGQDQSGKSTSGSEIDPATGLWPQLYQLSAVENMPRPDFVHRGGRGKI